MTGHSQTHPAHQLPLGGSATPQVRVSALGAQVQTVGKAVWAVALAGLTVWAWTHTWFLP